MAKSAGRSRFSTTVTFDPDAFQLVEGLTKELKELEGTPTKNVDRSRVINSLIRKALFPGNKVVPVTGSVAGGSGVLAESDIQGYVSLPDDIARGGSYLLKVKGNSMEPTIKNGDMVLVRPQPEAQNNQIVVAEVGESGGNEGIVKRLRREGMGAMELRSDNADFEPILCTIDGPQIVGIVVALLRQF